MKSAHILCTNSDLDGFWLIPVGACRRVPWEHRELCAHVVWAIKPDAEKLLPKSWVVPGHAGEVVI